MMANAANRPGEIVALAGAYWVLHHEHRERHRVYLDSGTLFPLCRTCHEKVRYMLDVDNRDRKSNDEIHHDTDFQNARTTAR